MFRAFGLRERHNFKLRYFKGDEASAQRSYKLDAFATLLAIRYFPLSTPWKKEMHGS